MKKLILNYLVIVAVAISAVFTSCDDDDIIDDDNGIVRLLEAIIYNDGTYERYEYDDENRNIAFLKYGNNDELKEKITYIYDGNNLIKSVQEFPSYQTTNTWDYEYMYSANEIIGCTTTHTYWNGSVAISTIDFNSDGNIVHRTEFSTGLFIVYTIEFLSGNITKITTQTQIDGTAGGTSVYRYEYDDKKSPFYYCKPHLLNFDNFGGSLNNRIAYYAKANSHPEDLIEEYEYEYDSDGFPIKCITKSWNGTTKSVAEYKYKIIE